MANTSKNKNDRPATLPDDRTPVPNDRRPAKAELDKDLFG